MDISMDIHIHGKPAPKVVLALSPQPRGTSSAKVSSGYTP